VKRIGQRDNGIRTHTAFPLVLQFIHIAQIQVRTGRQSGLAQAMRFTQSS